MLDIHNVKFRNGLLAHVIFVNLKRDIIDKVRNVIPDLEKLKLSQELTTIICNLIENLYSKKKSIKIDKKSLCVSILTDLFPSLTQVEIDVLKEQIQYIFDNKMIVKFSFVQRFFSLIKKVVKKFLP